MEPVLSRCGYRCDLCLAYRPNIIKNSANRSILSDGWYKYYGFRLLPESICCDGCMAESPDLIDQECPVRPCVLEKGLDNCSHCEQFACDKLQERLVVYEDVQRRVGAEIPEGDYIAFIWPYENKRRLDVIKNGRTCRKEPR